MIVAQFGQKIQENSSVVATYEYDLLGRKIKETKGNGTVEKTSYNPAGLVTSVKNSAGDAVISEYFYAYFYDGNQRTKTEFAGISTYVYDGLSRLKTAVLADGTQQNYTFDANGNRAEKTVT